jgi:hypothetical protein
VPEPKPAETGKPVLDQMVDRFLGWKLPLDFSPDCGISFKRMCNEGTLYPRRNEPIGTNLLDATQAKAMLEHVAAPALAQAQDLMRSIQEFRNCPLLGPLSDLRGTPEYSQMCRTWERHYYASAPPKRCDCLYEHCTCEVK